MKHRCCETCTSALENPLQVGVPVMVLRDTKRWPRVGTWKRYDGQTGLIRTVNVETHDLGADADPRYVPFHVEYGIRLNGETTSWFLPHEVRVRV